METTTHTFTHNADTIDDEFLRALASINGSFSKLVPGLQLAWDSTSFGALKRCARYYELGIMRGYAPRAESVHLVFGIEFHAALELYDRLRTDGLEHEPALLRVLKQ